jgi:putative DNA primase/helicase
MFVYGEKHTGKSTFLYTLDRLLGKHYAIATDIDTFKENTYGNSRDSRKARLAGKRYVFLDETSAKEKIDTAGFKKITAGYGAEEIARKLYGQPFNYPIEYMLVIGTNELPRLDTNDPALWDRVCPVLFSQSIPFEERDGRLPEKLDAEQSGILNWMLHGLYAYMEDGKQIREIMPQALQELKEKLRLEFAPVEAFVQSQLTFKNDAFESIARLDTAFERWCALNDIDTKYIKKYALSKFLSKKHKLEKDKRRIEEHHNPVWGFIGVKFDGVIEEGRYYPSDF